MYGVKYHVGGISAFVPFLPLCIAYSVWAWSRVAAAVQTCPDLLRCKFLGEWVLVIWTTLNEWGYFHRHCLVGRLSLLKSTEEVVKESVRRNFTICPLGFCHFSNGSGPWIAVRFLDMWGGVCILLFFLSSMLLSLSMMYLLRSPWRWFAPCLCLRCLGSLMGNFGFFNKLG